MKICSTCGVNKSTDQYHRDIRFPDGHRNHCKLCSVHNKDYKSHIESISQKMCNKCMRVKALEDFVPDTRRTLGYGMQCLQCVQIKLCRGCQVRKHVSKFNTSARSKDGFTYQCKDCANAKRKKRYDEDKIYRQDLLNTNAKYRYKKGSQLGNRERLLLKKYKMSLEDYEARLEAQNGRCKVCLSLAGERGRLLLAVDHDHKCCPKEESCGQCIRGLLCDPCNRALGMLQDDEQIVQRALDYLKETAMANHFG